jgi:dTDP-L-rhamnose 4-epimerase
MSKKRILITGGAGFIGSHLADDLIADGHSVRVLDSITPRVHTGERPIHLHPDAELVVGDIRDGAVVERALERVDVVFHLAAAVSVGESLYEVERCTSVNNVGTAVLIDRLARTRVERLILASSLSVYGEGLYRDPSGAPVEIVRRKPEQLRRADWEPRADGEHLTPVATPETKIVAPCGVYARSKFDQERMCMRFGRAFGVSTLVLRLFHVFGVRPSSNDPYSGHLSRWAARVLDDRRPLVAEDGGQLRDLVHVRDVSAAFRAALTCELPCGVFNIGSGRPRTLASVAQLVADIAGKPELTPECSGRYELGDVRHCFADIARAREVLGYRPAVDLEVGLEELVEWIARHPRPAKSLTKTLQIERPLGLRVAMEAST